MGLKFIFELLYGYISRFNNYFLKKYKLQLSKAITTMPRLEGETLDEYIERISQGAAAEQLRSAQLQVDFKTTQNNIDEYNRRLAAVQKQNDRQLHDTVRQLKAFVKELEN